MPQREQLAITPEPPLPKGKSIELSVQSTKLYEERVKMSERRTLARKREIRAGTWKGKDGLHSEGRGFQGGKGGQIRRVSLGEVEGSMSG